MAKDLVRTRKYAKKFMLMKANIQGVSLKIQTLRSQNSMAEAMKGVTRAMQNMNRWVALNVPGFLMKLWRTATFTSSYCHCVYRQMNLPQIQRILQEFEKQSEIMDMKEEIMNEAMDDAMEDDGDEEETWVTFPVFIVCRGILSWSLI